MVNLTEMGSAEEKRKPCRKTHPLRLKLWCQRSPDPLGDGPVLLALLGEDPLHAEGLQGRHGSASQVCRWRCGTKPVPQHSLERKVFQQIERRSITSQLVGICTCRLQHTNTRGTRQKILGFSF